MCILPHFILSDHVNFFLCLSSDSSLCSDKICEPAWIVPIQWDKSSFSISVAVKNGPTEVNPTR